MQTAARQGGRFYFRLRERTLGCKSGAANPGLQIVNYGSGANGMATAGDAKPA